MYYLFSSAVKYNTRSYFDVSSAANNKLLKLCNNAANIQDTGGVLFYFTSIEILSDLRLEKCGPLRHIHSKEAPIRLGKVGIDNFCAVGNSGTGHAMLPHLLQNFDN